MIRKWHVILLLMVGCAQEHQQETPTVDPRPTAQQEVSQPAEEVYYSCWITLRWDTPKIYTDGTPIKPGDLAYLTIYSAEFIADTDAYILMYQGDVGLGVHEFHATVTDIQGRESVISNTTIRECVREWLAPDRMSQYYDQFKETREPPDGS